MEKAAGAGDVGTEIAGDVGGLIGGATGGGRLNRGVRGFSGAFRAASHIAPDAPAPVYPSAAEGPRFPSGNMSATEGEYVAPEPPVHTGHNGPPVASAELVRPRALAESAS